MRQEQKYPWESETDVAPDAYAEDTTPILCVDFDGTLMQYVGWHGAHACKGDPIPGAMAWLRTMVNDGHWNVMVHSSRSHQLGGINAMRLWILGRLVSELGIEYIEAHQVLEGIYFPRVKPPAVDSPVCRLGGTRRPALLLTESRYTQRCRIGCPFPILRRRWAPVTLSGTALRTIQSDESAQKYAIRHTLLEVATGQMFTRL